MANPQHIEWLLEGVEAWNARRKNGEVEKPDFEGVDFYQAFHDAGKIDGESRIPLDKVDLSCANLNGANLSCANLNGANLSGAYLVNADLWRAQAVEAKFWTAIISGARLDEANLTKASFINANLEKANLMGANLTEARLMGANLNNAVLMGAILCNTYFYGEAILNNTNLINSEPWKAKLYNDRDEGLPMQGSEQSEDTAIIIQSIEGLLSEIRKIKARYENGAEEVFIYFRGEARSNWDLCPSIMQKIPKPTLQTSLDDIVSPHDLDPSALHDYAHDFLDFERWFNFEGDADAPRAFERDMLIDLMARRPEEFNNTPSTLAQWVLAQHHGLKTRFLDVTKNPLVALYHACEKNHRYNGRLHVFVVPKSLVKPFISDTASVIANFAKLEQYHQHILLGKRGWPPGKLTASFGDHQVAMHRLYQLIREEKPNFEERIDPRDFYRVFVVEPQQSSERIRAQSGAFLVSAFHERFERAEILRLNGNTPIYAHYELTIPAECKAIIVEGLRMLNITRETLFPGLDSSAAAITESYRQRREPGGG